jgi:hypothetical protein
MRDAGHYNRTQYVYTNDQAGLRLTLPPPWLVRTERQRFTVPLALRPDQVQVLEAYHAAANLGLVAVVQAGPVAGIDELVQRMRAVPEARLHGPLPGVSARDIRQRFLGKVGINGHDAAAWIYTATDTAGGQPIEMTVSFYILKIREHYVYLTFSTPAETYENAQPVMEAVLRTVTLSIDNA